MNYISSHNSLKIAHYITSLLQHWFGSKRMELFRPVKKPEFESFRFYIRNVRKLQFPFEFVTFGVDAKTSKCQNSKFIKFNFRLHAILKQIIQLGQIGHIGIFREFRHFPNAPLLHIAQQIAHLYIDVTSG